MILAFCAKIAFFQIKRLWLDCALFVKTKFYFCCCKFANKQIKQVIVLFSHLYCIHGRTRNIPENACSFGSEDPNQ